LGQNNASKRERENPLISSLDDPDYPFKSIDFAEDVREGHDKPIFSNFVSSSKGAIFNVLAFKMVEIGASTATHTPGFTEKLDELIAALRNGSG
jgi:hypothetical protein